MIMAVLSNLMISSYVLSEHIASWQYLPARVPFFASIIGTCVSFEATSELILHDGD